MASYEAARRLRAGDEIRDVLAYISIRSKRIARDNASLWALLPDPDPIDFARAMEPGIGGPASEQVQTTRVIDGVEHRFILGTGWCPPLPLSAYPKEDA